MITSPASLRADARRNREAVLDAASALFASRGDGVQMTEIAERAGLGVGTLYRHFPDKRALRAAIIGRRFEALTDVAREAALVEDPWEAFETLLRRYLESIETDAAFRMTILGAEEPAWEDVAEEKTVLGGIIERIVDRAVEAGALRPDFRPADFVLLTRGAAANMTDAQDWRRHVSLLLDGVRQTP